MRFPGFLNKNRAIKTLGSRATRPFNIWDSTKSENLHHRHEEQTCWAKLPKIHHEAWRIKKMSKTSSLLSSSIDNTSHFYPQCSRRSKNQRFPLSFVNCNRNRQSLVRTNLILCYFGLELFLLSFSNIWCTFIKLKSLLLKDVGFSLHTCLINYQFIRNVQCKNCLAITLRTRWLAIGINFGDF